MRKKTNAGVPGTCKFRSKEAFTLMELMVTIGILTLLSSLLFPAISRAKARARTEYCKNNLRKLGQALVMYEGDFRYYPGAGDCAVSTNQWPYLLRSTNSWIARIRPYVGTDSPVYSCPEYDAPVFRADITAKWESYGYNGSGSAEVYYALQNLGLGLGKDNFVNAGALKAPSDMIALGDLALPPSVGLNVISPSPVIAGGQATSIIPKRHARGANMVFADSHVEWAKHLRWTAETDSTRSRWNNDHQPHPETW
jgi:prepilin-type processing-associated H-X9-DG protein/prepilin-type N-terminal cleavage/methylation domain-containing protein